MIKTKKTRAGGFLLIALVAIIASLLFSTFVVSIAFVYGPSMEPSYKNGSVVLVDRTAETVSNLKTGDVIVFRNKSIADHPIIKRIAATPGDTVEISNGALTVNGELRLIGLYSSPDLTLTLDDESYFVLGDNVEHSVDSRDGQFGTVKQGDIMGKVIFKLF